MTLPRALKLSPLVLLAYVPLPHAASEVPRACLAAPALLVVAPDGTDIPAARLVYKLDARRVEIVGDARVFCHGFEG